MFLGLSCRRHDFSLIDERYVQHSMCPGAHCARNLRETGV